MQMRQEGDIELPEGQRADAALAHSGLSLAHEADSGIDDVGFSISDDGQGWSLAVRVGGGHACAEKDEKNAGCRDVRLGASWGRLASASRTAGAEQQGGRV